MFTPALIVTGFKCIAFGHSLKYKQKSIFSKFECFFTPCTIECRPLILSSSFGCMSLQGIYYDKGYITIRTDNILKYSRNRPTYTDYDKIGRLPLSLKHEDHAESRPQIAQLHALSRKRTVSAIPIFFLACLTQGTHYLTTIKALEKLYFRRVSRERPKDCFDCVCA